MSSLEDVTSRLAERVDALEFGPPVTCVYNPLDYAWEAHATYLDRYGRDGRDVLLLGMNPGPWGMVQTGVPFGDVVEVKEWLGIDSGVRAPRHQHPRRPILGFDCERREQSGRRLWGWARERFGTPKRFFRRFFVLNYCPLAFLEESGRSRSPDKLAESERAPVFERCDEALEGVVEALGAELVIGIGRFAESRAKRLGEPIEVGYMPHPSPANPRTNVGWCRLADEALERVGAAIE